MSMLVELYYKIFTSKKISRVFERVSTFVQLNICKRKRIISTVRMLKNKEMSKDLKIMEKRFFRHFLLGITSYRGFFQGK